MTRLCLLVLLVGCVGPAVPVSPDAGAPVTDATMADSGKAPPVPCDAAPCMPRRDGGP